MWILLIAVVGIIIFFVIRSGKLRGISKSFYDNEAAEIAKRRYARGEISKEEFEEIMRNLGKISDV